MGPELQLRKKDINLGENPKPAFTAHNSYVCTVTIDVKASGSQLWVEISFWVTTSESLILFYCEYEPEPEPEPEPRPTARMSYLFTQMLYKRSK